MQEPKVVEEVVPINVPVQVTYDLNGGYFAAEYYLENNETIDIYEDVILKNNLLYKKEIDISILKKISSENELEDIYNKCIK